MADETKKSVRIGPEGIEALIAALKAEGYAVIAPVRRDGAIVLDEIDKADALPKGWGDEQDAGSYRTVQRGGDALFAHRSGPQSWKKYLYPARERLWDASGSSVGFMMCASECDARAYAFFGVHACDVHAMDIHDRVFMSPEAADPRYGRRRAQAFIVAVNCTQASKVCFCASMGTGPKVEAGFDIALTEIADEGGVYYIAEAGTERGAAVLAKAGGRAATPEETQNAAAKIQDAARQQVRSLDRDGIKELLYGSYGDARWDEIAERCLSCANCTMACPTCFCSKVEDTADLSGANAQRWRLWDSCFTLDFSYIHGGSVRKQVGSRYRQWITHKLAAWIDQFGISGCVGCGRCIAWCPVGIDITEEARAIRDAARKTKPA